MEKKFQMMTVVETSLTRLRKFNKDKHNKRLMKRQSEKEIDKKKENWKRRGKQNLKENENWLEKEMRRNVKGMHKKHRI